VRKTLDTTWQAGHANTVIVTDLLFAVVVGFGFGNGAIFKLVAQYFPKNTARQSQDAKEQRFKVQASERPGSQGI
jgi:nitrate/nitrite transporter NarK